jgi:CubicO group peptidase (beta-lactamase class C family)
MPNQPRPDATTVLQGLDDFVRAILEEWKGRGVALTVLKDNEVIYAEGFGVRDEANHLPVTPQTLFPIASCTKAFTTASLALLADQGRLDWDTPVRAYLPSFRLYDAFATERVTPRDLVSHRTGLPRHDLAWYNNTSATRQELFERLAYLEPAHDLRTRWHYQNLMYMLAGYLVEVVSGQTWEAFVQQHLFQPLEMTSSTFDIGQTVKEASDFAHPYTEVRGEVKEIPFYAAQNAVAPAGAIVSNITELSHWVLLHLNGGVYKGQRILSEQQVRQLHTPQMVVPPERQYPEIPYSSYAMGWSVEPYRGYPMVDHSGGIDGFRALTTLFPTEGIGVVVLSNRGRINIPEILTYSVFERLMGLDETPWSARFLEERRILRDAARQSRAQAKQKRVEGAQPSHALEAYTGEYAHPGYGTLAITLKDNELHGTFNGMTFPARHYHYDIFEFVMERWEATLKASFVTNVRGDIDSIIVPFEPTTNDIVFKRAPAAQMQTRAFLEPFVGIYEFLNMQLVVYLKDDHTLCTTVATDPVYELVPYQGTEFLARGCSGVGIAFERDEAGVVTGAAATFPSGVFHAVKKR